jgi:hypothetical protein
MEKCPNADVPMFLLLIACLCILGRLLFAPLFHTPTAIDRPPQREQGCFAGNCNLAR